MKRYIMRRDLYYHMCYECPSCKVSLEDSANELQMMVMCDRKKCTEFYKLKR